MSKSASRQKIRKELDALRTRVDNLRLAGPNPRGAPGRASRGGDRDATASSSGRRGRSRRRSRSRSISRYMPAAYDQPMSAGWSGSVRIKRREILATVKLAANTGEKLFTLWIGTGQSAESVPVLPWLSALSKSFERIKYHNLLIEWQPAVGTTEAGMIALGYTWDYKTAAPKDLAAVVAETPSISTAVYSRTTLRPTSQQLMTRKWLWCRETEVEDTAVAGLLVYASGEAATAEKTLGIIWCEYDVEFLGTQKA